MKDPKDLDNQPSQPSQINEYAVKHGLPGELTPADLEERRRRNKALGLHPNLWDTVFTLPEKMTPELMDKYFPNWREVRRQIVNRPWSDDELRKALDIATRGQLDLLSYIEQEGGVELVKIRTKDIQHAAKLWTQRAVIGAQEATLEAERATPYLDAAFNERRRTKAQEAMNAANATKENAKAAEDALDAGDYDTAIAMSKAAHASHNTAKEAARLAAMDETLLGVCPHCMTFNSRFTAKAKYTTPSADGSGRATLRFKCSKCNKHFNEVVRYEVLLLDRIIE